MPINRSGKHGRDYEEGIEIAIRKRARLLGTVAQMDMEMVVETAVST